MKFNNTSTKFILTTVFLSILFSCHEEKKVPYLDMDLSMEDRVNDLVGRMTLEEKIGQMVNEAPAIERLGVPEYNWWSEGLHGVARAGLATVFPQAIGLAATWDEQLMHEVSSTISDEARAKHHQFAHNGKRFIYQGLTFWSPNINIFRDPRWGRGQETYGEDPFLTGRMGVQFIKGLQGDDPKYLKTIATVKHFAVHSGPEPERHTFDAHTSERYFREFYLPQFEMGIKEGKAYSAMCAYNRLEGEACCGSDHLLNQILRDEWGFQGYVVSDCGAIEDIYLHHKIVATSAEAAALAVKSGTDIECGTVYAALKEAIDKKLITEADIDVSVKRLFMARFKLGMFDDSTKVKYTQIPYSVVDSKPNKELALKAARESVVLLKNDKGILPLKKDLGTVAVIGPNSDQWLMLLGNYNGVPSDPITPLRGIREKVSASTKVLYAQGSELAGGIPMFDIIPSSVLFTPDGKPGLKADYYSNRDRTGDPLFSGIVGNLDANFQDKAPREDMDDDNFGVKWSGVLKPERSGMYQLGFISTCNTQLYLNDSLLTKTVYHFHDEYGDPRLRKSDPVYMEAGKSYKIVVDAGEFYADAQVQLVWANPKPELKKEALDIARKADVIIMCMGLTARMEGEEMDVEVDGFKGGDRTRIDLPDVQQDLIRAVQALGKPMVLVMLNGSAIAVNWENDHVPAIVESWYGGQAAGQAIADVLFGDYNPGGRLPVTFYKSVKDLPPFEQYDITTQTYRYFNGKPLYPFGFGLSYTTFEYSNVIVPTKVKSGDSVDVSVNVKNSGTREGDEVVQVYLKRKGDDHPGPLLALNAFKRVHLASGEEKTITLKLTPSAFSVIGDSNMPELIPGSFEVSIGGGQPGYAGNNTLSAATELID